MFEWFTVHAQINQIETAYFVNGYSAADAWPLRGISSIEEFDGRMICGQSQLPLEKYLRMPYPQLQIRLYFENQRLVA